MALARALQQLPPDQRRAIVLHHLCDLSVRDIAAETGVATGTVKARLSRGRAALATLLTDEFQIDVLELICDRKVGASTAYVTVTAATFLPALAFCAILARAVHIPGAEADADWDGEPRPRAHADAGADQRPSRP